VRITRAMRILPISCYSWVSEFKRFGGNKEYDLLPISLRHTGYRTSKSVYDCQKFLNLKSSTESTSNDRLLFPCCRFASVNKY
jgi:hypothetical protein